MNLVKVLNSLILIPNGSNNGTPSAVKNISVVVPIINKIASVCIS